MRRSISAVRTRLQIERGACGFGAPRWGATSLGAWPTAPAPPCERSRGAVQPSGVIRLELTKSGHRREVPLSSNADAVLARRWRPEAKGYVFGSRNWNSFRSAWEAALDAAGIESFRFHDLRHTFASWLVQRGRTLKEVQEALGHQTISMTMRYSHLAPDHLRAAVAVLDGVLFASQPTQTAAVSAQASTQEPAELVGVSQKSL